ncbi:PEP-CTERM sorting domain-containing protein [Puniceicoccus vermicola]|uniref:PEP-CTERM sorting domain-containing protein n=1 Tax=Puniceicoccus vermicola TaxID=388746 RepID=A0A7X1AXR6_9BACT|nr:PEP-CTERM sorting domain-containing protein [Puniceicoccus vermicola]MBC2601832.1 PEP-CTERM sorting domain-containing protein [Puniceicoccus vermicola]
MNHQISYFPIARVFRSRIRISVAAILAVVLNSPTMGQLSTSGGYSASEVFSTGGDAIVSYRTGADGNLYYMTAISGYLMGGVYRWDGVSSSSVFSPPSDGKVYYNGASVVSVNNTVYFNYSTSSPGYYVRGYNTSTNSLGSATETPNYALASGGAANPSSLWIDSGSSGGTDLSYANTDSDGAIIGGVTSIGTVAGNSGPLGFDSAGNLYYAQGYGASNLYGWSAVQVASAISDPVNNALSVANAVLAYDWSSGYAGYGGSSIAFDDAGDLYLTLTDFMNSSVLVQFAMDGFSVSGSTEIASSSGRLGEVVFEDGQLFVANDDGIYSLVQVPEPAHAALFLLSAVAVFVVRRRKREGVS